MLMILETLSLARLCSSHQSMFTRADINGDGYLDATEIAKLTAMNPTLLRGLGDTDKNLGRDKIVDYVLSTVDSDHDGKISQDEFLYAVSQAQITANHVTELAAENRERGLSTRVEKRFIWLIIGAFVALIGSIAVGVHMDQMEQNTRKKAGNLLNYIDLVYWERGRDPEPKCTAYMYYSTSCTALGNSWSSHCSEGGEKVFESRLVLQVQISTSLMHFLVAAVDSSRKARLHVDSLGAPPSAEKSVPKDSEQDRVYQDLFFSSTTESTVGACRNKCGTTRGCVGLVGPAVGSNDNPLCPRIPDGYAPISVARVEQDARTGERLADDYANSFAKRELQSRAPDSFDPRPSKVTSRKDQNNTSLCVSFTTTTMVEGTVQRTFDRSTTKDLSPIWVAVCRAQQTSIKAGNRMFAVLDAVGNSYIATEDCIPWSLRNDPKCQQNQCGLSDYGKLPYISDRVFIDAPVNAGKKAWERMKEHLSTIGPVSLGVIIDDSFQRYAATLASESGVKVFYDGHPDYQKTSCAYGGHAMTIIGYGHFTKPGTSKPRLSGKNGYVFIAAGSLGSANTDSYGVKASNFAPFSGRMALFQQVGVTG
ncbi:hypothetical protein DFH09DRAFT_1072041 [Mycena vulgaris]|nr:hypothetical protein DFH09DRAFT_1072041 [Mycena vulgaris]